mgnify:CR=1 FL=1
MANIEERISTKGIKTYKAQIRLKGYKPQYRTFTNKLDAELWCKNQEQLLKTQRNNKDLSLKSLQDILIKLNADYEITETEEEYIFFIKK